MVRAVLPQLTRQSSQLKDVRVHVDIRILSYITLGAANEVAY